MRFSHVHIFVRRKEGHVPTTETVTVNSIAFQYVIEAIDGTQSPIVKPQIRNICITTKRSLSSCRRLKLEVHMGLLWYQRCSIRLSDSQLLQPKKWILDGFLHLPVHSLDLLLPIGKKYFRYQKVALEKNRFLISTSGYQLSVIRLWRMHLVC